MSKLIVDNGNHEVGGIGKTTKTKNIEVYFEKK